MSNLDDAFSGNFAGKTDRQLVSDMWDAVGYAWAGTSIAVVAPLLWAAIFLYTFPWDEPYSTSTRIITGGMALGFSAFGIFMSVPWFRIDAELNRRRRQRRPKEDAR